MGRANRTVVAIVTAGVLVLAGVSMGIGVLYLVMGNKILPEVSQSVASARVGISASMRKLATTLDQKRLVSVDRPQMDAAFGDLDQSFNKIESEIRDSSGNVSTCGVVLLVLGLAFGFVGFVMQLRREAPPASSTAAIPGGAVAQGGQ